MVEEECYNENYEDEVSAEVEFEGYLISALEYLKSLRKKNKNLKYQLLKYEEQVEKLKTRLEGDLDGKLK